MEELLNKLFDKLEDAKMYNPTYSYDVKIANQTIRSFFEDELSKFSQHDVMVELPTCIGGSSHNFEGICTACGKRH